MIWSIFRFEVRYWLRGMMVWIFLFVIGAMVFAAASSDKVTVGASIENTLRNAPYVIQTFYSILSLLTLLMTTAFVNSAAARDFQYGTYQLVFSTPLRKLEFLLGRFLGAAVVSILPILGVSLGIILAAYMPWVDAERWGPIAWAAHGQSILAFAIPNTLFVAAIIFCIAALTRSTVTSFLGALVLLVGYTVAESMTEDLDNETLGMMLDPFGIRAFVLMTKYWTVAERNGVSLGLEGMLLWNRLLWLAVGAGIFAFTAWRFSFSERAQKADARPIVAGAAPPLAMPSVQLDFRLGALFSQLHRLASFEFLGLVKTTSFIVLLAAALLNTVPSIFLAAREGYGNSSYPVTYWILDLIQGTLYLFSVSMITYYAGVLVWRERDARMDEIEDATPQPVWLRYLAKSGALLAVMAILQGLMMMTGIGVQSALGYRRYQLGLYFAELFVYDFSLFVFLVLLAFFIHVISPNKYVGYFAFVIFLIGNATIWAPLNVATRLLRYASRPEYTYSDFYGHAPFLSGWWWFTAYWAAFALLLATATAALWPRGKETALAKRFAAFSATVA